MKKILKKVKNATQAKFSSKMMNPGDSAGNAKVEVVRLLNMWCLVCLVASRPDNGQIMCPGNGQAMCLATGKSCVLATGRLYVTDGSSRQWCLLPC